MSSKRDGSKKPSEEGLDGLEVDDLRQRVDKALVLVDQIIALFPELVRKTEEDQKFSEGRMRTGEGRMLGIVLNAVDLRPELFTSLADRDEGHDPKKLETGLLRDRLQKRELYYKLAAKLKPLASDFDDTALHFGELVRPAVLAAYRIAKTLSETDQQLRTTIAEVIDFFRAPVKNRKKEE